MKHTRSRARIVVLLIVAALLVFTGCAEKPRLDEEKTVRSVLLSVIDGEETDCGEAQTQEILRMYAECGKFRRNRDNAGVVPPNPVEIIIRYENGQSITVYHPGTHKIGIRDKNGESWFAENEELYAYLQKLQEEELTRREKEMAEQQTIDAAEDIIYSETLEFLVHHIPYEEIEALCAERRGLYVITIPQGTELEFMPGCTLETTADTTLLAQKYNGEYYLIVPWHAFDLTVHIPKHIKRTEKGPGNTVVSPNALFVAQEEMRLHVEQDDVAKYLNVETFVIQKGAECRLDLTYESGRAELFGMCFVLGEDEVINARELTQKDLAVTWFDEESVEGYLPVPSGKVVYKLSETDDTVFIWGTFTQSIGEVPKEWILPLDFDILEQQLPEGDYVFATYGGGCASPPNWWLGLYEKSAANEEMRGDAPYFFTSNG